MSVSTLQQREAALLPQSEDGIGIGAVMAVLVHVLLVMALAFGVSWRVHEPEGVTAELWASVPQIAAPKAQAPEPTPTPVKEPPKPQPAEPPKPTAAERDAEIALEKAERAKQKAREDAERKQQELAKEKAEKDKQDQLAKEKAAADAKRKKDDEKKQAELREKLRQEQLQRILGQAGGTGAPTSTGKAARDAGPSATYAGRVIARIKPNIVLTDDIPGNPAAEVELRVAPDGTILGRKITQSSGVKAWDDAVLRAVDRTEMLPRDVDGRVPSTMIVTFRPKD